VAYRYKHGVPVSSLRAQLLKKDPLQINPRGRKPILHSVEPILVNYLIYRYEHGFAIPLDRFQYTAKDLATRLASQLLDIDTNKASLLNLNIAGVFQAFTIDSAIFKWVPTLDVTWQR